MPIEIGDIGVCTECGKNQVRVVKDILSGDRVRSECFESLGAKIESRSRIISFCCDAPYMNEKRGLHTKDGWKRPKMAWPKDEQEKDHNGKRI